MKNIVNQVKSKSKNKNLNISIKKYTARRLEPIKKSNLDIQEPLKQLDAKKLKEDLILPSNDEFHLKFLMVQIGDYIQTIQHRVNNITTSFKDCSIPRKNSTTCIMDDYDMEFSVRQKLEKLINSLNDRELSTIEENDRKELNDNLKELQRRLMIIESEHEKCKNFMMRLTKVLTYVNQRFQKNVTKNAEVQTSDKISKVKVKSKLEDAKGIHLYDSM